MSVFADKLRAALGTKTLGTVPPQQHRPATTKVPQPTKHTRRKK